MGGRAYEKGTRIRHKEDLQVQISSRKVPLDTIYFIGDSSLEKIKLLLCNLHLP